MVSERDATRRALVALRELKQKHGINFVQELAQTPEEVGQFQRIKNRGSKRDDQTVRGDKDDEEQREIQPDAMSFLNACLETHDSDNKTNRKLYKKSPRARSPLPEDSMGGV